jgi:hypothetical protein
MPKIIEQLTRSKILFSFAKMRGIIASFLVAVFCSAQLRKKFFP